MHRVYSMYSALVLDGHGSTADALCFVLKVLI